MEPSKKADLAATGIAGLDEILRGGLPRNRLYLVTGRPGVGKTTLALQFLLEGAAKGEACLYITLSETLEELGDVARSHGWSLDKLTLYELKSSRTGQLRDEYTMYHPSEVELSEAMSTILDEVERKKPSRVVFDSLSEIKLLAQEPLRYRRQVLALKNYFVGKNCTVLLLDDHTGEKDTHLESLAHGVIALQRESPAYGATRRRVEIEKLRGVQYRNGYHDFAIEPGGIAVYPRLTAPAAKAKPASGALLSGVASLDELLGGGLLNGTATLLIGPAGSGKSALASQYALAAAAGGHRTAFYTFDESVETMLSRAESLGLPMRQRVDDGSVHVVSVDPAEMTIGRFAHGVREAVGKHGARVVVIDSLTGYLNAIAEEQLLLNQMHELFAFLGHHGVVTILIATQHGLIGTNMQTPVDVSYLADTVILLRYFEAGGTVRNALSVVKKRTGPHERTIREFALGPGGVKVGAPLYEFHGVLTGVPSYTGKKGPLIGNDSEKRDPGNQ